jgi:hypothetical protein
MTAVAIVREETKAGSDVLYRAITHTGRTQSVGRTPGEALDALTAQLDEEESGTLVVVQQMRPDRFFTQSQVARLQELMQRFQAGEQSAERALTAEEEAELHALIEAELLASARRSEALADALGR